MDGLAHAMDGRLRSSWLQLGDITEGKMKIGPKPPKTYDKFVQRYPKLAEAWDKIGEAGRDGPLDAKTVRLIKLAIAIGAMREGAVHSGVRKALASGISLEEI